MRKKTTAKLALQFITPHLIHGAKTVIANKTGKVHANVQTAFRGMAGEDLTNLVLRKTKQLPKKYWRTDRKQVLDELKKHLKNVA